MEEPWWLPIAGLLVAVAALLRPEFTKFIQTQRSNVELFFSARTEVGFSDFGPTFAVIGTLRASGCDQMIRRISLTIVRISDNATHEFDWSIFRRINYLQQQNSELEVASAFLVPVSQPRKINILFNDETTQDSFKEQLLGLRNQFRNHCQAESIMIDPSNQVEFNHIVHQFFEAPDKPHMPAYNKISKDFYWEPGKYSVNVLVETQSPSKSFIFRRRFSLSDEESELLRLNAVMLLDAACFVQPVNYNFAHVKWDEL